MYLSGVRDRQPIAHAIVGGMGSIEVSDSGMSLSTTGPVAGGPMLIDTGAQVSVLDIERALSLQLPETDIPTPIIGVAGAQEARQFTGLLHLPAWNITRPTTFIALPMWERLQILGIIGMDILSEFVLTIHGPNATVNLERP